MKCFNHPALDAVGTCSQCGKATCRDCIEDVGGALLCERCFGLHKQAHQEEERALAAEQQSAVDRAKRKMMMVFVFMGIGALVGMTMPAGHHFWKGVENVFDAAYAFPCAYLGVPPVWRRWKSFFKRFGFFVVARPGVWFWILALFCYIPFAIGFVYGILGGGIYQFVQLRKAAKANG